MRGLVDQVLDTGAVIGVGLAFFGALVILAVIAEACPGLRDRGRAALEWLGRL